MRLLSEVNGPGLAALRRHLAANNAVAFLGAGVSAPLYPLWRAVIDELIDEASARDLDTRIASTLRDLATDQPDSVVELLRQHLGVAQYQAALRHTFRVRRDPISGATWTPAHEVVCRMPFAGIVTTNYDPGIVDARIRVRPQASSTGFASWTDESRLDDWLTGDVLVDGEELPVLFAHGHHNQPDAIVLATTEYRRAYAGKLAHVLARLIESQHLVWIGFSFADARIGAVLREVAETAGTRISPGRAVRHVAIMPWDPATGRDPSTLRHLAEVQYGADLILYPAPDDNHSALLDLLAQHADTRFPAVTNERPQPARAVELPMSVGGQSTSVKWEAEADPVAAFVGRREELERLDRWAADPSVRLVGVSAWGGAGKTTLIKEWIARGGGALDGRPQRAFGWSFYADASVENWMEQLLQWLRDVPGVQNLAQHGSTSRLPDEVLAALALYPVTMILDGLEVLQEGPAGEGFGRLLVGDLRDVLTRLCRSDHRSLAVLTSRFPFADLQGFDGGSARMLELPPLTPDEGAALLGQSTGWLPEPIRRELVEAVDGHALAVNALGEALAGRDRIEEAEQLRAELMEAGGTDARVAKVLRFYADQLADADKWLVAAVGLFARPVAPQALLTVAGHDVFGGRLAGWTPTTVRQAASSRLNGLVSLHPDGTLSAHPLVRDAFRRLALGAAKVAANAVLGDGHGPITSREDGLRVVEAVELLLDAGEWQAADDLLSARVVGGRNSSESGTSWIWLPAVRLGLRVALAFVGSPVRRSACADRLGQRRMGFYCTMAGLHAMYAGDLVSALDYLQLDLEDSPKTALKYRRLFAPDWSNSINSYYLTALSNLGVLHSLAGRLAEAQSVLSESLSKAQQSMNRDRQRLASAYLGRVASQAGEWANAERHFLVADTIAYADSIPSEHLHFLAGAMWADFLALSGRLGSARKLTERNRELSTRERSRQNIARCDRILAVIDLAENKAEEALAHAIAAVIVFRDGEMLPELAISLLVLADAARATGDLSTALEAMNESLDLAGPRGMLPAQSAALTARSHVYADQAAATTDVAEWDIMIRRGRDDADTALRLCRRHGLVAQELCSLEAHSYLDEIENRDNGWASKAALLRAQLNPQELDPQPLATVEQFEGSPNSLKPSSSAGS